VDGTNTPTDPGEVGTCCTPAQCGDPGIPPCSLTPIDDGCGGTINCTCGDNGTCIEDVDPMNNACLCDENYGVIETGPECIFACDGYLPPERCCDSGVLMFCTGENLRGYSCLDVCGWDDSAGLFDCGFNDPVPPEVTPDCPSNINYDPGAGCDDDILEDNDTTGNIGPDEATVVETNPQIFNATKCAGDEDFYAIDLEDQDTLTVTAVFSGVDIDIDLALYYPTWDGGSYDNYIAGAHTVGGSSETLSWTLDVGSGAVEDVYYLRVEEYFGDSGNYSITFEIN
jgi:hypothetical protein